MLSKLRAYREIGWIQSDFPLSLMINSPLVKTVAVGGPSFLTQQHYLTENTLFHLFHSNLKLENIE